MSKSIAVIEFPSGYKNYYFKNPIEDLEVGDYVVCDTSGGYSVGKVIGFKDSSAQATKFIVQRVDLAAHQERVEKQKKIDELKRQMEKRRKEIEDIQVYSLLAQADPEMATMLNELLKLEGKT
jgi:hypothetical protein